jgi:eukaryotic-like serine/threonine-protein kinase
LIDPRRSDVRDELARLLAARVALAERMHQHALKRELAERLSGLLHAGADPSLRGADQVALSVRTRPPGASVSIARFEEDAAGRLTLRPAVPLVGTEATLVPGSYVVTGTAGGHAPVRLPVFLVRGQPKAVALSLPPESAVPPGFVFVPAGETLIGSDEESLRSGLTAPPLHPVMVESFLIGRFEVTFADYIAWLETLAPDEQARRTPRNRSRPGAIELRLGRDHRFLLALQPTTQEYLAAWGEPIRYPGRTVHAVHDWRRFPVTGVSFEDAEAFAAWLDRTGRIAGARVCREEEWERAARGADGRIYTTGRQLAPSEANIDLTYGATDAAFGPDEVGSHPASASVFGVEDLQGNAEELIQTRRWSEQTTVHSGSWYRERITQRLDNRFRTAATTRNVKIGFRLCASITIP